MKAFLGLLLLLGFVCVYWKLTLCLLLLWAVVKAAPIAYRELQEERAGRRVRAEGLRARADRQRVWFESGDPRWVTGERMQG
jgi:hypothetical protein